MSYIKRNINIGKNVELLIERKLTGCYIQFIDKKTNFNGVIVFNLIDIQKLYQVEFRENFYVENKDGDFLFEVSYNEYLELSDFKLFDYYKHGNTKVLIRLTEKEHFVFLKLIEFMINEEW